MARDTNINISSNVKLWCDPAKSTELNTEERNSAKIFPPEIIGIPTHPPTIEKKARTNNGKIMIGGDSCTCISFSLKFLFPTTKNPEYLEKFLPSLKISYWISFFNNSLIYSFGISSFGLIIPIMFFAIKF